MAFSLFGATFRGFDRGMTVKIQRPITVKQSIGGSVRLIPYADARFDAWEVEAELWVSGAQAQSLEAVVPPYGIPNDQFLRLPRRAGANTFPGLAPFGDSGTYDLYFCEQATSFESMGRKAPKVDLYGYKIGLRLFSHVDGGIDNIATTPTTTAPTWLQRKFAAHQIQDWSATDRSGSAAYGQATPLYVQHGRRRDVNLNLDHMDQTRADQLVAYFRGVRHNTTSVQIDNGPNGVQTVSVYLAGLELHRQGLLWDGTLEMVLA